MSASHGTICVKMGESLRRMKEFEGWNTSHMLTVQGLYCAEKAKPEYLWVQQSNDERVAR